MSYYELVKTIKLLKDAPMDEQLIKKIDNDKIKYHKYALTRLIAHIYNTVDERLNNSGYKCLKSLVANYKDIDAVELDFINLKKEKIYVLKLAELKMFDIDTKTKMSIRINRKFEDVYEYLKQQIKNIDVDGMYLNRIEKIM